MAHHRRPHHPGQRERRARRAVGGDRGQGPAAARQDVPRSTPPPAASSPTTRSRTELAGAAALRRVAARRPARSQDAARPRARVQPNHESVRAPPDLLRLHRGGAADPAHPDGRIRRRAAGLDGHRHPDGGAVAAVAAALRLLRRTLRPGDQPAAGRHPRGGRHLDGARHGPGAEPARAGRRVLPADRAAAGRCSTTTSSNKIVHINDDGEHARAHDARCCAALYDVERGGEGARRRARASCAREACDAIAKGARTLVISDRDSDHTRAPIPSLLLVSAVHHHLVRTKERTTVALVVESGDAREVHHIAHAASASAPPRSTRTWRSSRSRT